MEKTLVFCLALLCAACGKSSSGSNNDDTLENISRPILGSDVDGDVEIDPATGIPVLALAFSTNISLIDFTLTQEEKYQKAVEVVKLVVKTEEFRERVLNHTYEGKKTFVDNGGITNAQIYETILNGAESLQPTKNNRLDAEVELYYAANNVIGYTYPSSTRIWVNTKYFDTFTVNKVAGNLFHEWLHKLGYKHASTWSVDRDHSVPYAIGYIVGDIGQDFL